MTPQQQAVCRQYGEAGLEAPAHLKVGIAPTVRSGLHPINGLRHPPEGDTTGWYIWAGEELSDKPDFFVALHVEHLDEWAPVVLKFLALPPGWLFLKDGDYEDVWYDESLIDLGRRGSSFPDITATRDGRTVRVNTVDTRADGRTPTTRETTNAARIRAAQGGGNHTVLIPKPKE